MLVDSQLNIIVKSSHQTQLAQLSKCHTKFRVNIQTTGSYCDIYTFYHTDPILNDTYTLNTIHTIHSAISDSAHLLCPTGQPEIFRIQKRGEFVNFIFENFAHTFLGTK